MRVNWQQGLSLALALAITACSSGSVGEPNTTSADSTSASTLLTSPSTQPPISTSTSVPVDPISLQGWEWVGLVPVTVTSGAIVEAIDKGIVVVGTESTSVIGFDGSSAGGEKSPVTIQAGCCGSVVGIPVRDGLILIDAHGIGTWALDSEKVTWSVLGDRPGTGEILGTAVIGNVLYVVNAAARAGGGVSLVSALDLNTGRWSEVEQVPSGISVGGVTTDGEELIVAGVLQDTNNRIIGDSPMPVAYEYGVDGWQGLPDIPIGGQASTIVWVEGAGVLAWNYSQESALLSATGTWEVLGSVPMDASECYPSSSQTESGIVGLCGGLAYFDAGSRSWAPIPTSFPARYVVARDSVYQLTPMDDTTTLAVYELPDGGK